MPYKKPSKTAKPKHQRDFENMQHPEILNQVLKDFEYSQTFQEQFFTVFREVYKNYRSYVSSQELEKARLHSRSKLFIPYTYQIVETVVPKLMLAMFEQRPYARTVPLGVNDNEERREKAKSMNNLLEYFFMQKMAFIPTMADVFKNLVLYGTAITKQKWDYKTRKVRKKVPKNILGFDMKNSFRTVETEVVECDNPVVEDIDIQRFYFDPAGMTIKDQRYNIQEYWIDRHELLQKNELSKTEEYPNGIYINLDKVSNRNEGADTGGYADVNNTFMPSEVGISEASNGKKGIHILEYWLGEWLVMVANENTVVLSIPNPFDHMEKPFVKWTFSNVPHQFYGEGTAQPIKDLQDELNTIRNQRIDNVSIALNKMWKIRRDSSIDTKQLISRPAGFVEVDEMDDLEEIEMKDVTQSGYNEETIVKQDIDLTTGVNDTQRGSSPERRETATTMSILDKAGSERFQLIVLLLGMGGFKEMVAQIIGLVKQYVDKPTEILITGEDEAQLNTATVYPSDIQHEYDIIGLAATLDNAANKEVRLQNLTNLYNFLKDRPELNHSALIKEILELYEVKNVSEIMTPPAPPMPPVDPNTGLPIGGMPQGGMPLV